MVLGRNIEDPEQGKRGDLTYNFWVTDISKNSVLILVAGLNRFRRLQKEDLEEVEEMQKNERS